MQLVLLILFALAALFSFVCRLRVGMLEGAVARGAKSADDAGTEQARFDRLARIAAFVAAICLILCMGIGVYTKLAA